MPPTIQRLVRLLVLALALGAVVPDRVRAQTAGEKKPVAGRSAAAETDYQEFAQLRRMASTKDEPALQKVVAAGFAFLSRHAASPRATEVVNGLAFYANAIDGKRPDLRAAYLTRLKAELAVAMRTEGADDDTRAAWLALVAALADHDVRAAYNADNLALFRRQIDLLAQAPASGRFLIERERSYLHVLSVGVSLGEAAAHLQQLLSHSDPAMVAMARVELNLVELKQAPLALKFVAWDGRPVDLVKLRGRVVLLHVWSTSQKAPAGGFEAVRKLYDEYRKRGLEVVSICVDPAENRAKVAAALQRHSVPWPVHFDGLGFKHPLLEKLNLSNAPALLLLDQKGFLQHAMQGTYLTVNLPHNQVVAQTRRLLVIR